MLQAIIFDLDQTLLDRTATFRHFLEAQYLRFRDDLGVVSVDEFVASVRRYDNNGYAPKREVYAQVCRQWSLDMSDRLLADFEKDYGQEPILFAGVVEMLETLKTHYKLGLITNGQSRGQNAKIDNAGIRHFFNTIKISEEEGVKKPDPAIFGRCLSQLGVTPQQAVYVGDHPEKDVLAAQRLGIKGIWMRNAHYPEPESANGIINNLSELANLLALPPFS